MIHLLSVSTGGVETRDVQIILDKERNGSLSNKRIKGKGTAKAAPFFHGIS